MTQLEGKKKFIAGGEESYGYFIGDHVRDKDAIVSAVIIAEMAAYYKDQGSSLYQTLLETYVNYGLFRDCLLYTSDAADDLLCVDLGGRRIIKKKNTKYS
eukprot:TRINITY_DN30556_c0_g1_i1.p1 TRINITY_DN30556_c0_g1~~TRINITY_DN30556_c0_g1_i1.p1  ORF type:complete len:100 (+),score=18.88 TRINITY_DN30556_c0_g1_i1:162-461(+)